MLLLIAIAGIGMLLSRSFVTRSFPSESLLAVGLTAVALLVLLQTGRVG